MKVHGEDEHPQNRHRGNHKAYEHAPAHARSAASRLARAARAFLKRKNRERNGEKASVWPRQSREKTPCRRGSPLAAKKVVARRGRAEQEQRFRVGRVEIDGERIGGKQQCRGKRAFGTD